MADLETVARAWFDTWGRRDFDALAELYTPDADYIRSDGVSKGIDEILAYLRGIADGFPDEVARIETVLVASDGVTVEWKEDATHTAPFSTPTMGVLPPTGKGFKNERIVTVFQFRDGKIASQREYYNQLTMIMAFGWTQILAALQQRATATAS